MESFEVSSGGGVGSKASSLEDPQQGQLRSLSAHVDTHEHETLQKTHEVTDDNPDKTSVLTFPPGIDVSSLSRYIMHACNSIIMLNKNTWDVAKKREANQKQHFKL